MKYSTQIYLELFKRGNFDMFTTVNGIKHLKQELALKILIDNITKDLGYGGAAGGAKSWTGCVWLAFMCLLYPGTRYFIGREELKRLRDSTLITFFKVCQEYGIERDIDFKYNGQDHYIQFLNGSRIDLLDLKFLPSDPLYERYGSVEYTSGWIEEGGEVNFAAYDVLKSRVGRCLNDKYEILSKTLTTLNPKKNWCYNIYWKPFKENKLPSDRKFIQVLVDENPFISKDYIENLNRITDKITKQRLRYGDFEYDDDENSLIKLEKINDIFTNTYVRDGVKYISCDLAITNDMFVCYVWSGFKVIDMYATNQIGAKEIIEKINQLRKIHQIPVSNIVYDADGLGGYMRSYLPGAVPIFNNSQSPTPEYKNLKACLNYKLADEINAGNLWVSCDINLKFKEMLCADLGMIKRSTEQDEKLGIMNKALVKQILGRSPDFSDALAFRMLFKLTRNS